MYYIRIVSAPGLYTPRFYAKSSPSGLDRVSYINALLTGRVEGGPLFETTLRTVRWTTVEAFPLQIRQERRGIEQKYGDVLSQLVERGYLTANEAAMLHPDIQVVIQDDRQDTSTPLPAVE